MGSADRIKQMIALTRAGLAGGLTAAELRMLVGRITSDQAELPLGIGTTTEAPK